MQGLCVDQGDAVLIVPFPYTKDASFSSFRHSTGTVYLTLLLPYIPPHDPDHVYSILRKLYKSLTS